jgi:glycosyltransferase involved in cell wall biosynthesis
MRIVIADVHVPFISGGGEALAKGLLDACRHVGHQTEMVSIPFRFSPITEIERNADYWEAETFDNLNGYSPDLLIALRFPSYYSTHRRKAVWLLHQHRAFYDLWNPSAEHTPEEEAVRKHSIERDTFHLSKVKQVHTISRNVTRRLEQFNGISSIPLYHPPPMAGKLHCAAPEAYIFAPSRLETLKRQWLLIQAAQYLRAPLAILISGEGGQRHAYEKLIEELGVGDRVHLIGRLTEQELAGFYGSSLGVFFGPQDEDYGYITLEAMLAKKPVITCSDSGGPLEFVVHDETGLVVEPTPQAVAAAIERLYSSQRRAANLGAAGFARYQEVGIRSWGAVVDELTQN